MQNSLEKQEKNNPKTLSTFSEILKTLVIAFMVVIPIRMFIAQPFIVSGASMDPTFENGDYLIVDELSYRFNDPERLDVVIFKYPKQPEKFFIKRVIGLPGESVSIDDGRITVTTIEGIKITIDDSYIQYPKTDQYEGDLGLDEYFVLGDNRAESSDSRTWGPLNEKFLIGKAFLRLFPTSKLDYQPGKILEQK